jgi:hypothetical protein
LKSLRSSQTWKERERDRDATPKKPGIHPYPACQAADAALIFTLVGELAVYEKLVDAVDASASDLSAALFCDHPRVFCDLALEERPAATRSGSSRAADF